MRKERVRAHHSLVHLPKRAPWTGWKKATGAVVIAAAIIGGVPGTALAATPAVDNGLYDSASVAMPQIEQPEPQAASSKYLSTNVDRNHSPGLPPVLSNATTTAATRCPAFVTWEDWVEQGCMRTLTFGRVIYATDDTSKKHMFA